MRARTWVAGVAIAAGALGALALGHSGALGFSPPMVKAGALVLLAVGGWAWGRVPEHIVALAFFTLAMLLSVAPAQVVFSGFASSALWLIFGGQAMGAAIQHTGLASRIARATARRLGSRSYGSVIAGVVTLGLLLGFVMPSSMSRIILLMPIAASLADRYGFRAGSNGRTGMLLATAFGTYVPSFAVLPANVPNAVLAGAADSHYGLTLGYGEYLALHFPVLGLLRAAVLVALILLLFPDRLASAPPAEGPAAPPTGPELFVAALLALALLLWATDFVHHIPAAWVSLAVGLVIFLPWTRLVPPRAFNDQVNYASLFFVAGILGVGAVISHSGLGTLLAQGVRAVLPFSPGAGGRNFAALSAMGTLVGIVTTSPGIPAVMTPIAASIAAATGLSLRAVLMTQVIGFSNNLLPYQSPPLVVATQISDAPLGAAVKLSLALFAATTAVLLPLDYLWWRLLGWIG